MLDYGTCRDNGVVYKLSMSMHIHVYIHVCRERERERKRERSRDRERERERAREGDRRWGRSVQPGNQFVVSDVHARSWDD